MPRSVDEMLAAARDRLVRLHPHEADAAIECGALLIDIRSESQRRRDGVVPHARFVARNVLEWRCDPSSSHRDEVVTADPRRCVIVMCDEGYQSSLAAATLQDLGLAGATDLIGGFQAWRAAGLAVVAHDDAAQSA